jgi:hypothetical protein
LPIPNGFAEFFGSYEAQTEKNRLSDLGLIRLTLPARWNYFSLGLRMSKCPCDTVRMKGNESFMGTRQIRGIVRSLPQFIGAMDSARAIMVFPSLPRRSGRGSGKSAAVRVLPLNQAMLVQQAELWLKLGEPEQALQQLKSLSRIARRDSRALKMQIAAIHAAREQNKM